MRKIWMTDWLVWLLSVVAVLGLLGVLSLARNVGRLFGGFAINRSIATNEWQVESATPSWWPALAQGELRYLDILVSINSRPFDTLAYRAYAEAYKAGDRAVTLIVKRGQETLETRNSIKIFTWDDFFDLLAPGYINSLSFWLLAVAVYRSNRSVPVNRMFVVVCGLLAGTMWATPRGMFIQDYFLISVLDVTWAIMAAFVGTTLLHLAALFPEPLGRGQMRFISHLHWVALVIALFFAFSMTRWWQVGWSPLIGRIDWLCYRAVMVLFFVGSVFFLARCVWRRFAGRPTRRLRSQLSIIGMGTLLAFPYIIVTVFGALLKNQSFPQFWQGLDLRYLIVAAPMAFALVILRYKSFRSTHPLFLPLLVLASSALVASIVAWTWWSAQSPEIRSAITPPFLLLLVVVLPLGLFWVALTTPRVKGFLTRVLQWEATSYEAFQQFGQRVAGQTDPAALPHAIATALVSELSLEQAAVWLLAGDQEFLLAGHAGEWPQSPPLRLLPESSERLNKPIRLQGDGLVIPGWLESLRKSGPVEVTLPLIGPQGLIGLLALGKRTDEEIFVERDLEVLNLIAQQAALFLVARQQVQRLRQMSHALERVQEEERYRIAQDLHDTIQQSLNGLVFHLKSISKRIRNDPARVLATVEECISDAQGAIQTLYQIRYNLDLSELNRGFIQPLRNILNRFERRWLVQTLLQVEDEDLDSRLSIKSRAALYRVVLQALDNVAAHAHASQATVAFRSENGQIRFSINDNGNGFSEQEGARAVERGHMGLVSMRTRIENLGGKLLITSAVGTGTTISGWIPADA